MNFLDFGMIGVYKMTYNIEHLGNYIYIFQGTGYIPDNIIEAF